MASGQWCYECGKDNPAKYEAVYTPRDGGMPLHLVICESCGRGMESDAGAIEVVNDPAMQAKQPTPTELPERE
jgi:hypothetical protein